MLGDASFEPVDDETYQDAVQLECATTERVADFAKTVRASHADRDRPANADRPGSVSSASASDVPLPQEDEAVRGTGAGSSAGEGSGT